MYKIEKEKLWDDTKSLYEEYRKENKQVYENEFKRMFHDIEHYSVTSEQFFLNQWLQGISIDIERYCKTKTYFRSVVDLEAYACSLRLDPLFRKMTKLCFYIEENVEPFNTIDEDIKESQNK